MNGHRTAELRSIELHRIVAARIADDEAIVTRARERVASWVTDGSVARVWADRWADLLDGERGRLLEVLVADDELARDLRQVTPFAGVVSNRERWRILREVS